MKLRIIFQSFLIPLIINEIIDGIIKDHDYTDTALDDEELWERASLLFTDEIETLLLYESPIEEFYPENSRMYKLIKYIELSMEGIFPEIYPEILSLGVLSMNEITIDFIKG